MCAGMLATMAVWGQSGLAEASLEQLLDIQVTTVSKKEQKLARTAAAVFVLGAEEIRRSGALTLPDLLRLVPGVQVAQIDANAWAIAIRGFNSRYSNKVLVLVDGRVVYNTTFSGVYWDQVDRTGGGHRAHRGDSRTGGDGVGGERGQRGDQCDHAAGEGYSGRTGDGGGWFRACRRRDCCVTADRRVPTARTGRLPGIRVLRDRQLADGLGGSRRVVAHARRISLGLGIGAAGWAHGARRLVR